MYFSFSFSTEVPHCLQSLSAVWLVEKAINNNLISVKLKIEFSSEHRASKANRERLIEPSTKIKMQSEECTSCFLSSEMLRLSLLFFWEMIKINQKCSSVTK